MSKNKGKRKEDDVAREHFFKKSELPDNLYLADDVWPLPVLWSTMTVFYNKQRPRFLTLFLIFLNGWGGGYCVVGILTAIFADLNIKQRAAGLMNPIVGLQCLYKSNTFALQAQNYVRLLDFVKVDFLNSVPPEKEKVIKEEVVAKNVARSNMFVTYAVRLNYTVLVIATGTFVVIQTFQKYSGIILVDQPMKPCESEYPFEWRYGQVYYWVYAYEVIACCLAVFMSNAYEIMLLLLVMSLVRYLRVVGHLVEDLKKADFTRGDEKWGAESRKKALQQLVACVKDHQKITSAGDKLAENYNAFLTFHLGTAVVIAIIATFSATIADTSVEKTKFLAILALTLLEVALYCYCGQLLEDASEDLQNQVYYGEWEEMDVEFRKTAQLMMVRAISPLCLTAGRLYRVNLETLGSILQMIYTSFTMLTTMYED